MFCDQCGKRLVDGARFCDACGNRIQPVAQVPQPVSTATEAVACEPAEVPAEEIVATPAEMPVEETVEAAEVLPVEEVSEMPVPQAVQEQIPQPVIVQPAEKPVQAPKRRKPHIGLRIAMQFLSFVLCVVLMASLLATVVLADVNHLTSAGGIKQLVNALLLPSQASGAIRPVGAAGVGDVLYEGENLPLPEGIGDLDISDLPADIFTGDNPTEALVDWIMDAVAENYGEELPVTKEQVQAIVEKSTVTDFVAEKVAGYADDYINGTENTTITVDEIMQLIEENEQLLEEELKITITEEDKAVLQEKVEEVVEQQDLNNTIRQEVFTSVDQAIEESTASMGGMNRDELMSLVQTLTATQTLLIAIAACVVLMLLLFALNFYNLPAGLTWSAMACMIMGLIVALPVALLQIAPDFAASLLPDAGSVVLLLIPFVGILAPFHYGLFGLGVVLLIGSVVWRVLRNSRAKKRSLAAA